MRFRTLKRAAAVLLAIQFASAAPAAELIVDGSGELTGATGVDVGGTLYDVAFVDGTCASLFSGCDELADFTFQTDAAAAAAAQALLDQVFLDGGLGAFDTAPELTSGCSVGSGACSVITPYLVNLPNNLLAREAFNHNGSSDFVGSVDVDPLTFDTSPFSAFVWARFTPTAAAVPEPGTWAMMLIGFAAVGFRMRRRRSSQICEPKTEKCPCLSS